MHDSDPSNPIPAAGRERLLRDLGAPPATLPELLRYTENPYREGLDERAATLPLGDEPHVEVWRGYAAAAAAEGVPAVLRSRLVQLSFPIREGISREAAYRAATRRGARLPAGAEGVRFEDPEGLELTLRTTPAGTVPILVARRRADFVSLVRALAGRNEPITVPDAMGACLVKGLVNWDRVARYRRAWAGGRQPDEAAWQAEFRRLAARKELFQDRVLLLSSGPYSAVDASDLGLGEDEWLADSLEIRRGHESFHYLTLRLFGLLRSNLLDELLADMAGLVAAYGRYREDMALTFLGLERFPEERAGARLEVYRGDLSEAALEVLPRLAVAAVGNLAAIAAARQEEIAAPATRAALLLGLAGLGLEGLAAADAEARFTACWRQLRLRMEMPRTRPGSVPV